MNNQNVESTSYLWRDVFVKNRIPKNGVIVEVAPGYEPKIGNALALLGFQGEIFLIEPDVVAATHIRSAYQHILPDAIVRIVKKRLQDVTDEDLPAKVDAVVASHPFDDMVIAHLVEDQTFFTQEKNDNTRLSKNKKNIYEQLGSKEYLRAIKSTSDAWKSFLAQVRPDWFIASQYPSTTLTRKKLFQRQNSGFAVLDHLKNVYRNDVIESHYPAFGIKGDPRWWIVVQNPHSSPGAIRRLGKSLFVRQNARILSPKEYEVIYIDGAYFQNKKLAKHFAVALTDELASKTCVTYADRQKDKTDIGLSGNLGSGRAVYYKNSFNILGVGRTTLCKSTKRSHSTGELEMIGAMRRVVISQWIHHFVPRAVIHPALIALKKMTRVKWHNKPIPLALVVRLDNGDLDRPSHVEYDPKISVDLQKIITEYARLDAECFAYRFMLGAWSNGNYSLGGKLIDLETVTFVRHRGPYFTASNTHPHTRFGYEAAGLLRVLHQLAEVKNLETKNIRSDFYKERQQHLAYCFLVLLGISESGAATFFSTHKKKVINLSIEFEALAKKIYLRKTNLNLYFPISEKDDPSLFDMSKLFRSLAKLHLDPEREKRALTLLVRKNAFLYVSRAKKFLQQLFIVLDELESENRLDVKQRWHQRLQDKNQDLPPMFKLNTTLKKLTEQYRSGVLTTKQLGDEIVRLGNRPKNLPPK